MTRSQTLAIRLSQIRQRLNEIAGLEGDDFTDESRTEADKLTAEFRNPEIQHRSAIIAEGEEKARAAGAFGSGDGEPAEVRALMDRITIGDYLGPAPAGANEIQNGNFYHAMGPNGGGTMRGDSVAAMWPTLEVIRDIYSQASQGVTLTWVTLWDAAVAFRSSAYSRVAYRLA